MSEKERLLAAVVGLQHYVTHNVDKSNCAACPRWDELQSAAMAAVGQIDALRAELAALRAALVEADEPAEMQDIGPEWKACVKLPITVHVREQRPGEGHISTREGITPCRPDDLIMRGVAGEEYPISREVFERTYVVGDATPAEADEPVAWYFERERKVVISFTPDRDPDKTWQPLYTHPPSPPP
jgi:hypothetical protein